MSLGWVPQRSVVAAAWRFGLRGVFAAVLIVAVPILLLS
jgi:hypothetical protein